MIVYSEQPNNTLEILEFRTDINGSLIKENFTVKDLSNQEEKFLYEIVKGIMEIAPNHYIDMNEMYPDEDGKITITLYPNPKYKGELDYE